MEVHLKPELEAKLSRMAAQQGRPAENLVEEAVARLVEYDDWFLRETETGLGAADRCEFVEHDSIRKLIDQRYRLTAIRWTKPAAIDFTRICD